MKRGRILFNIPSMTQNYNDIDDEIDRKEKSRFFQNRASKRPLGTCEECGRPIYTADRNGIPYRTCWKCGHGGS